MIVGSQLESAQLEGASDDASCTSLAQIQYNKAEESVMVKTPSAVKRLFPVDAESMAEFRSAMYPIGSFLHSFLTQDSFNAEMGGAVPFNDAAARRGAKWIDVGNYAERDGVHNVILIKKTWDFGQYLSTVGGYTDEDDSDGDSCWIWSQDPTGLYLRVSGTELGHTYTNGQFLDSQNVSHNHVKTLSGKWSSLTGDDATIYKGDNLYTIRETPLTETAQYYNSSRTWGNYIHSGGDQTQPRSKVFNLFLKVNR